MSTAKYGEVATGPRPIPVVGIGASAGGLESLEALFSRMPQDLGAAYVVIQHLSASHRSLMPELLSRVTRMPVRVAAHGLQLAPNSITLIPPGQFLTLERGQVQLAPKPPPPTLTLPIDRFFESLAMELGEAAVCIVMSGTGSDGTRGAERIHASGGRVIAEDPNRARFDGMPRSAINSSVVDIVLAAEQIGPYLQRLVTGVPEAEVDDEPKMMSALAAIVELLYQDSGVDFTRYKPATIGRRVARRMAINKVTDYADYLAQLQSDDEERRLLYRELLIRVTSFFRDPEVWEMIARDVIAPLVAKASAEDGLRIWVPGCSTGEEAYTLAMLALDEMKSQNRLLDLKVFATDIDREGLDIAARGRYHANQMASVSPERLERYFVATDQTYTVSGPLRKSVIFAHHNVARDAPFTRVDIVSCRNLLIYLSQELQSRVLGAFHFALRPHAALVLGSSESVGDQSSRFVTLDGRCKVFRSTGERRATAWVGDVRDAPTGVVPRKPLENPPTATPSSSNLAERALARAMSLVAPAGVLIDTLGVVRHVFGNAGKYVHLSPGSVVLKVVDMVDGAIAPLLSGAIPRALRTGESVIFKAIVNGEAVEVTVAPTLDDTHDATSSVGALITFAPTDAAPAPSTPDPLHRQLEDLNAELRRARRRQERLVEQLESSNEELQATNEEMVAANEELQATNEELQSVNEELHTVNAENARRIDELEILRHDLDHLLSASDVGTLVVDRAQTIRRFTPSVSVFLPVLERDIGRPIGHLANSLGGTEFLVDLTAVINDAKPRERTIDSAHGPVLVRMTPYRVREFDGALITFVDVSAVKRGYEVFRRVLDALPAHVAFLDSKGTITMVNAGWEEFAKSNDGQPDRIGRGVNYFDACALDPEAEPVIVGIRAVLDGEMDNFSHVYPCNPADGTERWFLLRCTSAGRGEAVVVHFDITMQKEAERLLLGLATHDPLTGALNRRGVETELEMVLRRARRSGRDACAVMLDCDDFKKVNDRVGHAGGDAVLKTIAHRISRTLRAGDSLARIGGDEFLVLLPEASIEAAHAAAERIRLSVGVEPVAVSHDDINLTVSAAVVDLGRHVFTLEHVLDRTRAALASSKAGGKNRVTDGVVNEAPTRRRGTIVRLIEENGLGVAAQPIVDVASQAVVGMELLTRSLENPEITPASLFRMASEDGMLSVLDEHTLKRCISGALSLARPGARHLNLYPSTLLSLTTTQFAALFAGISTRSHPIVVELSEQQLLGDPVELLPNLNFLRSLNVKVALDDVGFGRTSLETLTIVEPEIVKIDAACIRGIDSSAEKRRWLRRLVGIGRAVDAYLVAEGIEQLGEFEVVSELGVDACQGYYFGRPEVVAVA